VAHLIAHGHRRIGFVGDLPAALYTRRERFAGYRDALEDAGLPLDRALVETGHDQDAASAAVLRLLALPSPPTALFTANNFASMGAVVALARAGRRDVALVGFDDLPLADVLDPPLTVVAQDPAAIGAAAAELVLQRLDGSRAKGSRGVLVPTRLVVRGSGELPPPVRRAGAE
jgi:LacI family transcriptional regulator